MHLTDNQFRWKWWIFAGFKLDKESESFSVMSNSLWQMDYTVHGILQARLLEWVAIPFSRGLPKPVIEPRSSSLQADSLSAEPLSN